MPRKRFRLPDFAFFGPLSILYQADWLAKLVTIFRLETRFRNLGHHGFWGFSIPLAWQRRGAHFGLGSNPLKK